MTPEEIVKLIVENSECCRDEGCASDNDGEYCYSFHPKKILAELKKREAIRFHSDMEP